MRDTRPQPTDLTREVDELADLARRMSAASRHDEVITALRHAHPYEEPAFDVYVLL